MKEEIRKIVKCAVYTRKSTEEGLEQDFNSLDAQREACEAYIKSQQHEGWILVEKQYSDGGFSGGTLERPAIKELFRDIEKDEVDIVVVYKVDRLTRSLMDFSKIVELFDNHKASFVSITQSFNTTTSMGRLTLNMLLSFAQFEREVTGERIRDKIAASKKKGMWMGGCTPMGYKKIDKKLVIDSIWADKIKLIFSKYIELKSVRLLKIYLAENGIKSPNNKEYSKGQLYYMLSNQVYIGKIIHKEMIYEGEHEAIIDEQLFAEVQRILLKNRVDKTCGNKSCTNSLLAGLIFDDKNNKMSPSFSCSKNKRYHYYVSQAIKKYNKDNAGSVPKVPAGEIEKYVANTIKEFLSNKRIFQTHIKDLDVSKQNLLLDTINNIQDFSASKLIRSFLKKVTISIEKIEIILCKESLIKTIEKISGKDPLLSEITNETETPIVITKSVRIERVHERGNLLIIDADAKETNYQNPHLVNAIVKSHYYHKLLLEGTVKDIAEIQKMEGLNGSRYIRNIIKLKFLPPQITEQILNGTQSQDLILQKLLTAN